MKLTAAARCATSTRHLLVSRTWSPRPLWQRATGRTILAILAIGHTDHTDHSYYHTDHTYHTYYSEGDEAGDDERVMIDLNRVPPVVHALCF